MKSIKMLITGLVVGLLLGLWFGVNMGKGKPFYSNPFEQTMQDKAKRKAGEVLEDTKRALRESLE
ncbi:MAG: hypothetical protein OQK73_07995 [Gammaproteobacteria bacterium]|nr:hypothetical protein [Gammaproteobacteria bacterium]